MIKQIKKKKKELPPHPSPWGMVLCGGVFWCVCVHGAHTLGLGRVGVGWVRGVKKTKIMFAPYHGDGCENIALFWYDLSKTNKKKKNKTKRSEVPDRKKNKMEPKGVGVKDVKQKKGVWVKTEEVFN